MSNPEFVVVITTASDTEFRLYPMLARAMQAAFTARSKGHAASVYRLMEDAR